ncbi:MAG: beta-lactamase family protein [Chloroflexi bacterium]|nr:beta-lactamase family protein [Chloroflexota bacterium]
MKRSSIIEKLHAAAGSAITAAIEEGRMPGAVVLLWRRGAILLHEAWGFRKRWDAPDRETGEPEAMTYDTIFDLASLTKLFTATRVMQLAEQGRFGLDDPVADFVPEFGVAGKRGITVRQLLCHVGGLLPGLPLWELESSPSARLQRALSTPAEFPPATFFRYSDFSFITLGELIQRVDGRPLAAQIAAEITQPLAMVDTGFLPAAALRTRCAPTEWNASRGGIIRGEVHDENSWSFGGVAGHAGLFGTAADLLHFAICHLQEGEWEGRYLLQPETARQMQKWQTDYLATACWRGLGWELNQRYYMGPFASLTTFGHTGFTGTSLVIHPASKTILIVLANRVHPTRTGPPFNTVREAVASAVADTLGVE